MRTIAERSVGCLLAVAQPVGLGLFNLKQYRPLLDLEKDVLVRAIAERLPVALAT